MKTILEQPVVVNNAPPVVAPVDGEVVPGKPAMYAVILNNDNSTTPTAVIEVLATVFAKSAHEAEVVMMAAHTNGKATVAIFSHEVAEAKMQQANSFARGLANGNGRNPDAPCELTFSIEKETDGE